MKRTRRILSMVLILGLILSTTISGTVFAADQYYRYTDDNEQGVNGENTAVMHVQAVLDSAAGVGGTPSGTVYDAYCMDYVTGITANNFILNELSDTAANMTIRSIVLQSYPSVTVDSLKITLGITDLTTKQVITGTQWAIWKNSTPGSPDSSLSNAYAVYEYFKDRTGTPKVTAPDTSIMNFTQSASTGDAVIKFKYTTGFNVGYSPSTYSSYAVETPNITTGITSVVITIPEANFNADINFDILLTGTKNVSDVYKYEPIKTNQRLVGLQSKEYDADDSQAVELEFVAKPAISIEKTVLPISAIEGQIVTYTFVVTNTGNVDLGDVTVTDPLANLIGFNGDIGALAKGTSDTINATYKITNQDILAHSVDNTATVIGSYGALEVKDKDDATVTTIAEPGIGLVKSVAPTSAYEGDTVTYTFVVTNTGNVPLTGVTLADPLSGLIDFDGTVGALAQDGVVTKTATYVITNQDILNGTVKNTATVTGTDGTTEVTSSASATVTTIAEPGIGLVKTVEPTSAKENDIVTYTFVVTNTGNVPLTGVTLADPLSGLIGFDGTIGALAQEGVVTKTATYKITNQDILNGRVKNTATVTGTDGTTEVTSSASATVTTIAEPSISIVKSANTKFGKVGDVVTYSFTVTNTGNIGLFGVVINDVTLDHQTTPSIYLTSGQSVSFLNEVSHTLTEADLAEGAFVNTAVVSGYYDESEDAKVTDEDTFVVTAVGTPYLSITKEADIASGTIDDLITYTITVSNPGSVDLYNAVVIDAQTGFTSASFDLPIDGASVIFTTTHTIDLTDVQAGGFDNTATVSASYDSPLIGDGDSVMDEGTGMISAEASEYVEAYGEPTISIDKQVSSNSVYVGDTVTYNVIVTNTGNVPLSDIVVSDPMFDVDGKIGEIAELAVGASFQINGLTLTTTAVGTIDNTATVVAWDYNSSEFKLEETDSESVTVSYIPTINTPSITVSIAPDATLVLLGTDVTFTMVVRNTGNTILNGVTLTNSQLGFSETLTSPLFVGQSMTYNVVKTMDELIAFDAQVIAEGISPQYVTVDDNSATLVNVYEDEEEEEEEIVPEEPTPGANPETGAVPLTVMGLLSLLLLGAFALFLKKKKNYNV